MKTSKSLNSILHDFAVNLHPYATGKGQASDYDKYKAETATAIVEAVEGLIPSEPWEWKPYNELNDVSNTGHDPREFDFKVCTACSEHEFHPESAHICEVKDNIRAKFLEAIKEWQ